jgi:hypothetical protein
VHLRSDIMLQAMPQKLIVFAVDGAPVRGFSTCRVWWHRLGASVPTLTHQVDNGASPFNTSTADSFTLELTAIHIAGLNEAGPIDIR